VPEHDLRLRSHNLPNQNMTHCSMTNFVEMRVFQEAINTLHEQAGCGEDDGY
jgi:hypothetical protein